MIHHHQSPSFNTAWFTLGIRSESLFDGQFTVSTQLIKPNYLVILPTDSATQFHKKLTPFIQLH